MKLIFLKDNMPTAMAGDIKVVKTGFARNYLIPKGIAVLATKSTMDQVKKLQREATERRLLDSKQWEEKAKSLEKVILTITVQTGPTGRLYGSVTNTLVVDKLEEETGIKLDKRNVKFPDPIKMIGNYKVSIKLYEGINIDLGLNIIGDGTDLEEEVFEISDTEAKINSNQEKSITENKQSKPDISTKDKIEDQVNTENDQVTAEKEENKNQK